MTRVLLCTRGPGDNLCAWPHTSNWGPYWYWFTPRFQLRW